MPEASLTRPCAACGFVVFTGAYGSSDTCAVCGWVDDLLQVSQPDLAVGANPGLSLREAQSRVLAAYPVAVRGTGSFSRDPRWRPLAPAEYPAGPSLLASPVCYMVAPDPETFEPYWLSPREDP